MGNKYVPVSLTTVNHGIDLMIQNATRLYNDAALLYESKRYPTACSLAVLSIEELGKIWCYHKAAKTDPENIKEMEEAHKALTGHIKKQTILQMVEAFRSKDGEIEMAYAELKNIEKKYGVNNIKQWGFYVDLDKDTWLTPDDRIVESHASCLLTCAGHLVMLFSVKPVGVL